MLSNQEILARLILRPFDVEQILSDTNIVNKMNVLTSQKNQLNAFFKSDGVKFYTSSLLLKKRRFEHICKVYPLTIKYLSKEKLYIFWNKYLLDINEGTSPKQNPLEEGKIFGSYTLKQTDSNLMKELIKYEILKIEILSSQSKNNSIRTTKITAETFEFITSKTTSKRYTEVVIYKHLINSKIITLQLSLSLKNLINKVQQTTHRELIKEYQDLVNIGMFKEIL